jgi:regulatory protein
MIALAAASNDDFGSQVEGARELCLRQLHGRAHTSSELALMLRRKGVSDEVAEVALARLAEVGLVDDARFTRDWIERHGSGKSGWVLHRELVHKGIDDTIIQRLLDEIPEPDGIERSIIARRWSSLRGLPEEVQVRRAAGLLARRGFDPSRAREVLEQLRLADEPRVAGGH